MGKKLRLVVLGMMGRCPFGGQSWLYLNWLRGLARLGLVRDLREVPAHVRDSGLASAGGPTP